MLIKMDVLQGIRDGRISHVYRRWSAPRAKVGGRQRTPVGELAITSVEAVPFDALTATDAERAGATDLAALQAQLATREGTVYRIGLVWSGEDPRLALRSDTSPEAVAAVVAKLSKKDARADAPWTHAILSAIAAQPGRRAIEIAEEMGMEKPPFKRRVRQLKELGLTVSLQKGYRLSPRGQAVLDALEA